MMQMIIFMIVIIVLPLFLFFGVVGLAIFIWCWNRIGRYFINFSRWLGSWRNFIPLSILGILSLILMLVILPIIGFSRTLLAVFIVLFLVITIVIFLFALVAWTVRFCQWFWPPYRRFVWSAVASMWGALPQRSGKSRRRVPKPSAGPTPDGQPPAGKQHPQKRSILGVFWALMLGKPPEPAKASQPVEAVPKPSAQPPKKKAPVKRSWLGTFWALMLGKPARPAKPRPETARVQTTEQSLGPSGSAAVTAKTGASTRVAEISSAPKAGRRTPGKRSWFGSLWALMLGKPSKSNKPKPGSAKAQTTEKVVAASDTVAATAATGATTRVADDSTTPVADKKGMSGEVSTSIVRSVTFVVGLLVLGVVWVVQKAREGIEWIRIRLNLD